MPGESSDQSSQERTQTLPQYAATNESLPKDLSPEFRQLTDEAKVPVILSCMQAIPFLNTHPDLFLPVTAQRIETLLARSTELVH